VNKTRNARMSCSNAVSYMRINELKMGNLSLSITLNHNLRWNISNLCNIPVDLFGNNALLCLALSPIWFQIYGQRSGSIIVAKHPEKIREIPANYSANGTRNTRTVVPNLFHAVAHLSLSAESCGPSSQHNSALSFFSGTSMSKKLCALRQTTIHRNLLNFSISNTK